MNILVNKNDEFVISKFYKSVIWSIVFIFAFVTGQDVPYNSQFSQELSKLFFSGFLNERFYSIFEFLVLILSLGMLRQFKPSLINGGRSAKLFFLLSLIYFLFLISNPNNDAISNIFGLPLTAIKKYSIYFLSMYVFLFSSTGYIKIVVKEFGYAIIVLFGVKALLSLLGLLFGQGVDFIFYTTSSLTEEDLLIHLVLVQLLVLVFYLVNGNKIFLFIWILIFLVEFFSWRRSGFLLMLLSNFTIYGLYIVFSTTLSEKILQFAKLTLIVFLLFVVITNELVNVEFNTYFERYFGFIYLTYIPGYASNEHIEQANFGIQEILNQFFFWGNGIGNLNEIYFFNYKGNSGIHNAYVESWIQQGFFAFLYFISLFLFSLKYFINSLREVAFSNRITLKTAVSTFLFLFFVNAWVLIDQNFQQSNMLFIRVVLFSVLIKFKSADYNYLLNGDKIDYFFNKRKSL